MLTSLLFILISLVVVALTYIFIIISKRLAIHRAFRALPTDKEDQHWLLGHGPKLLRSFGDGSGMEWLCQLSRKHGDVIGMSLGPLFDVCMCSSPESAKISLGPDPKAEFVYSPLMPWLGESLLTGSGRKWARTRRLLTKGFHFDVLKPYVGVYNECAQEIVEKWQNHASQGSFDVFHSISLLTLDVMLRCTCSFTSNCQTSGAHSPYIKAVYQLSDLAMERISFSPAYFDLIYAMTPSYYKNRRCCAIVHKFSMDVIQQRRKALNESKNGGQPSNRKYMDFIDILLHAKDESGKGLTDEEIRAEVDTFMFEGHDTTAAGISWTLYNLAKYPEHQEKCREEVESIFGDKDEIEWEDLKKLTYLKYCIKESLRLFPPVAVIARVLSEDRHINGHTLLKGSWVGTNIYAIHHNPNVWEDPEKFDPLRFTPERSKNRHSHAFVPFSSGPRNCIGQEFALNEELVILSHILHNFEFSLDPFKPDVTKHFMIILRPREGLFLKLKSRF